MLTSSEAREIAVRAAAAVVVGGPADRLAVARTLAGLDGRAWLQVDQAARWFSHADGTPVSGVLRPSADDPTGFVAVVASWHVDGRVRERAVQDLATVHTRPATAALTVRLLDHVPQVRARAWQGLRPRLGPDTAGVVLDVLLAGRRRQHADQALAEVRDALLRATPARELLARLAATGTRFVRRWAFTLGHERGLLGPDELVAAARHDPDQWLRAAAAGRLDPDRLVALLDATSVEVRLVALSRVPDEALSDDALLTDRAPRVRDLARVRARRRGVDVAAFYRTALSRAGAPRTVAACLAGLAVVGDERDLPACAAHLAHPSATVRAAAVNAVLGRADRDEAVRLLAPVLLDPSPRVCTAAARGLARLGAPPSTADAAWLSARPVSRRAAWRLTREAGTWHRLEADLRAAGDPEPQLSSQGLAGVRNWLTVRAATAWAVLPDDQRARLAELLPASGLDEHSRRRLAFHAGIPRPPEPAPPEPAPPEPAPPRPPWWHRLLRRP